MKDVNPGAAGSGVFTAGALGAELFFRAYEPTHGEVLWVSDGTAGGTHILDDTCPGPCDSKPDQITSAGATVYFTGNDGTRGYEAFSYEYLGGVTRLDINPGPGFSVPGFLRSVGGTLYSPPTTGRRDRS